MVRGRKSGKLRSTPITPMTVDGQRYVLGGLPGSDWAANARSAGEVELRQGRNTEHVRLVELSPEDARPLLRLFPVEVPIGVGFLKSAGFGDRTQSRRVRGTGGPLPGPPRRPGVTGRRSVGAQTT
jgi:hypothetical protein